MTEDILDRRPPELKMGRFNRLTVVKELSFGMYLDSSEGEILLPTKYIPAGAKVGDVVEVFIYTDSEDRPIATNLKPLAQVGDFACLTVKHVTDFGAFMDWGLEKDLFVPLKEQHRRMEVGRTYVVFVAVDRQTNRVIGIGKIGPFLDKDYPEDLKEGDQVELMAYEMTSLGIMCIINNRYVGILYHNEVFRRVQLGNRFSGYLKKIREDNKIDLSLRKPGFEGIKSGAGLIISKLRAHDGFLPYNDDASPEDIYNFFQMSKKTFKALIGNLFRAGRIRIDEAGIHLLDLTDGD
jgi:uncharacterized protein